MYRSYCEQLLNTIKHAEMSQGAKGGAKGAKGEEMPKTLEELFKDLDESKTAHSLLKKYLTKELFNELKDLKTANGGTLLDCIKSGCEHLDSHCGIYSSDEDGYNVFSKLLDPVIKDYHGVAKIDHPEKNFGDLENLGFGDLDPSGEMILSTRVRVGRSHAKTLFCPGITEESRKEIEGKTIKALEKLEGDLKGKYYSLQKMTKQEENQLIEDHFLFKNDDRMLGSAGGYRHWPSGRGIFHNNAKTFLVWLNEEDHLRFISMQKGGDLAAVYKRLANAMNSLENSGLEFATRKGYGFLTFCPTNLGTAMRASVHIKIPKLSQQPDFKDFCEKLHLQPRGIHGENTESVGGVYDISNKRRLGLTEFEAITEMRKGIEEIIKREKEL